MANCEINDSNVANTSEAISHPRISAQIKDKYFKDYEELQLEVSACKKEIGALQSELTRVLQENQSLSDKLGSWMRTKIFIHAQDSVDLITNLRKQLAIACQEKDCAVKMWKMAEKEIKTLEEELKLYQDNKFIELSNKQLIKVKEEYSVALKLIEAKLLEVSKEASREHIKSERLEKDLVKAHNNIDELSKHLNEKVLALEDSLQRQCCVMEKLHESENKEAEYQEKLKSLTATCEELESALDACHKRIEDVVHSELEARCKVEEAVSLIELAITEKDSALGRESQLIKENAKLQQALQDLIEEAGISVRKEVDIVKERCNSRMELLLHDMKNLGMKIKEQEELLQKSNQERKFLEEEMARMNKDITKPETKDIMIKEENIKSVHQEVRLLEKEKFQLLKEKEQLLIDIQLMQERHASEMKIKMETCFYLERELAELKTSILQENINIESLSKNIRGFHIGQVWRNSQKLLEFMNEIQQKETDAAKELQRHLESQLNVKEKWKNTVRNIAEKFEQRLRAIRLEVNELKRENNILKMKLHKCQEELASFKCQHIDISKD